MVWDGTARPALGVLARDFASVNGVASRVGAAFSHQLTAKGKIKSNPSTQPRRPLSPALSPKGERVQRQVSRAGHLKDTLIDGKSPSRHIARPVSTHHHSPFPCSPFLQEGGEAYWGRSTSKFRSKDQEVVKIDLTIAVQVEFAVEIIVTGCPSERGGECQEIAEIYNAISIEISYAA